MELVINNSIKNEEVGLSVTERRERCKMFLEKEASNIALNDETKQELQKVKEEFRQLSTEQNN